MAAIDPDNYNIINALIEPSLRRVNGAIVPNSRPGGMMAPPTIGGERAGFIGSPQMRIAAKQREGRTDVTDFPGYGNTWAEYGKHFQENLDAQLPRNLDSPEAQRTLMGTLMGMGPGAVKSAGGMWHPNAVETLSRALGPRMATRSREHIANIEADQPVKYSAEVLAQVAADKTVYAWSDKALRNYLNKYAGTERDLLKDIEIPSGQRTARWEDLTDNAIGMKPAKMYEDPNLKAPPNEIVYGIAEPHMYAGGGHASRDIHDYLEHVGDYLRANVPPERLGQYDLVRAVRETHAEDLARAKKMNSVEGRSEGTVPMKEYPDKFKWVEVQSKDALDREGTQMGHCVGSYCDMVSEGRTKIYSLRDPKGASHVTVEVRPNVPWRFDRPVHAETHAKLDKIDPNLFQAYNDWFRRADKHSMHYANSFWPWLKEKRPQIYKQLEAENAAAPLSIEQIKGKQNRAPVKDYLPYVQDFVKSGKWGKVGDIHNAGLWKGRDGTLFNRDELIKYTGASEDQFRQWEQGHLRNDDPLAKMMSTILEIPRWE